MNKRTWWPAGLAMVVAFGPMAYGLQGCATTTASGGGGAVAKPTAPPVQAAGSYRIAKASSSYQNFLEDLEAVWGWQTWPISANRAEFCTSPPEPQPEYQKQFLEDVQGKLGPDMLDPIAHAEVARLLKTVHAKDPRPRQFESSVSLLRWVLNCSDRLSYPDVANLYFYYNFKDLKKVAEATVSSSVAGAAEQVEEESSQEEAASAGDDQSEDGDSPGKAKPASLRGRSRLVPVVVNWGEDWFQQPPNLGAVKGYNLPLFDGPRRAQAVVGLMRSIADLGDPEAAVLLPAFLRGFGNDVGRAVREPDVWDDLVRLVDQLLIRFYFSVDYPARGIDERISSVLAALVDGSFQDSASRRQLKSVLQQVQARWSRKQGEHYARKHQICPDDPASREEELEQGARLRRARSSYRRALIDLYSESDQVLSDLRHREDKHQARWKRVQAERRIDQAVSRVLTMYRAYLRAEGRRGGEVTLDIPLLRKLLRAAVAASAQLGLEGSLEGQREQEQTHAHVQEAGQETTESTEVQTSTSSGTHQWTRMVVKELSRLERGESTTLESDSWHTRRERVTHTLSPCDGYVLTVLDALALHLAHLDHRSAANGTCTE